LTFTAIDDGIVKLNTIKWRWFFFKYVCKYYRVNSNGDDNIKIEDGNKKNDNESEHCNTVKTGKMIIIIIIIIHSTMITLTNNSIIENHTAWNWNLT
jgi:hypothetical protein